MDLREEVAGMQEQEMGAVASAEALRSIRSSCNNWKSIGWEVREPAQDLQNADGGE